MINILKILLYLINDYFFDDSDLKNSFTPWGFGAEI